MEKLEKEKIEKKDDGVSDEDEDKKNKNSQALVIFEDKNEKNEEKNENNEKNEEKEKKEENEEKEKNEENEENKSYSDVNYWHVELPKDIDDDILKEIE